MSSIECRSKQAAFVKPARTFPAQMKACCRHSCIWHLLKIQIQTELSTQHSDEQPFFIADPVVSKFVFPCPRMTTRTAWDCISNVNPLSPLQAALIKPTGTFPTLMKAHCRCCCIWHLLKNQIQTKLSTQCSDEQPLFIADPMVSKFVFPCPRMTTRAAWDCISDINPLSPIRNDN
jgi:hypothetical protein